MARLRITPSWAPRVPQYKIRQLYEDDARGMQDDELIDDVGYALLARCLSFLEANEAAGGRVACPVCSQTVSHSGSKDEMLRCTQCKWELSWREYSATFQHKQLSGAEPVLVLFRDFARRFPQAGNAREKMILIDELVHGFHWHQKNGCTRPVAINLIEGRLAEVIAFLDNLTYGEASTPETEGTRAQWARNSQYVRTWALRRAE